MDRTNYKDREAYIQLLEEREDQLKFFLDPSDKIRPISDPKEIQAIITDMARRYFKVDRCYYGEIDGDKVIIRKDSSRGNIESLVGEYCWGRLLKYSPYIASGISKVEENLYYVENIDGGFKNELIEKGIISYILIPVVKKNNPVGIFVVSQKEPRKWTDIEVKLAIDIAERTCLAVEMAKAYKEKENFLSQTIEDREKYMQF